MSAAVHILHVTQVEDDRARGGREFLVEDGTQLRGGLMVDLTPRIHQGSTQAIGDLQVERMAHFRQVKPPF
jgi:hypothetical protein